MPFQIVKKSQVSALGTYTGRENAMEAARMVTAENYHRPPGTIAHSMDRRWRVDAQKPTPTHANIQVQFNGVGAPSTIACAIIPIRYYDELQNAAALRKLHLAAELTKAINSALHSSEKSRVKLGHDYKIFVYEVAGEFTS